MTHAHSGTPQGTNYRHGPLRPRPGRARLRPRDLPPASAFPGPDDAMQDPETLVPARFHLLADPSPGLMQRLLQPFAKRDLVPDLVLARRENAAMRVEIALDAMPAGMVHLVAGNLAQVIGVTDLQGGAEARRAA